MRKNPVTDADVQKEYDRVKAQSGDKEYHARHILVESEDQAKDLIAQLKKGAKFDELATKNSKDPGTAQRGGDLDWAVPGATSKQFSDAMVKLEKGKYTETPVKTQLRLPHHPARRRARRRSSRRSPRSSRASSSSWRSTRSTS